MTDEERMVLLKAKELLSWVEVKYRPPLSEIEEVELETGKMVYVRLHAIVDLYKAIEELEKKEEYVRQ